MSLKVKCIEVEFASYHFKKIIIFLLSGGYIGLFIGYTIAQAPELLLSCFARATKVLKCLSKGQIFK